MYYLLITDELLDERTQLLDDSFFVPSAPKYQINRTIVLAASAQEGEKIGEGLVMLFLSLRGGIFGRGGVSTGRQRSSVLERDFVEYDGVQRGCTVVGHVFGE